MKIEAHCITYNESAILPYWLRHYSTFANRMIVHDSFSTDDTREIAKKAGAEVVDFDMGGKVDDPMMAKIKGEAWKGTSADWVIFTDADEFVHFPMGVETTLAYYKRIGVPVIKPFGFEMVADKFPTTTGQIYDEVKMGARDDRWYGKPAIINPFVINSIIYEMGAHECRMILKNGMHVGGPTIPNPMPVYMMHMKHIDTVENIGAKYDAYKARFSDINIKNRWGNFEPGIKHAQDKRAAIMAKVERVIA